MIWMNILLGVMLAVPEEGLTIAQAEQILAERNPQLRVARLEVDEAQATLKQERLWENPEVSLLYNVYNPLTHRYFDAGREGELDIEVEQPIPIGGQRRERIRKQQAVLSSATYRQEWTAFALRMALHRTMTDLYILQEKASLYDRSLASVARILAAYRRLADEGNVSHMEVTRIEAMQLRLRSEQSEWQSLLAERAKDLRLLLGSEDELRVANIKPPTTLQDTCVEATTRLSTLHSPLIASKHAETVAAEHDLRLQRAKALPGISLKAEYDRNGNICHNFWGVGLTLSLPVFDHNQGNIRQSAAALERLRTEEQTFLREREQELALCRQQLIRQQQLLAEAEQVEHTAWTLETVEHQFLAHNLSLLELIDFYEAFRETHFLCLDAQRGVWQAAIDLNEKSGQEIISIK